jgi:hypothetical protein
MRERPGTRDVPEKQAILVCPSTCTTGRSAPDAHTAHCPDAKDGESMTLSRALRRRRRSKHENGRAFRRARDVRNVEKSYWVLPPSSF